MQKHQKPFSRTNRAPETVFDGQVNLSCRKNSMKHAFKLPTIDYSQLIGRDDFHISHKIGCILGSIGDTRFVSSYINANYLNVVLVFSPFLHTIAPSKLARE